MIYFFLIESLFLSYSHLNNNIIEFPDDSILKIWNKAIFLLNTVLLFYIFYYYFFIRPQLILIKYFSSITNYFLFFWNKFFIILSSLSLKHFLLVNFFFALIQNIDVQLFNRFLNLLIMKQLISIKFTKSSIFLFTLWPFRLTDWTNLCIKYILIPINTVIFDFTFFNRLII